MNTSLAKTQWAEWPLLTVSVTSAATSKRTSPGKNSAQHFHVTLMSLRAGFPQWHGHRCQIITLADRVCSLQLFAAIGEPLHCSGEGKLQNQTHKLESALSRLRSALELLDQAEAPAQIGAYVDLAIHQLEAAIAGQSQERLRSSD